MQLLHEPDDGLNVRSSGAFAAMSSSTRRSP